MCLIEATGNILVMIVLSFDIFEYSTDPLLAVACERGGVPADRVNMVAMFRTVRSTVSTVCLTCLLGP